MTTFCRGFSLKSANIKVIAEFIGTGPAPTPAKKVTTSAHDGLAGCARRRPRAAQTPVLF